MSRSTLGTCRTLAKCLNQTPCLPAPAAVCSSSSFAQCRAAVVGITVLTASSTVLARGTGFWVSSTCVVTSWDVVADEAGRITVEVVSKSGPVIGLDGVLMYAVPGLGIAFISVNPALYVGAVVEPVILCVSPTAVPTGSHVFAVGPQSYDEGVVTSPSTTDTAGYIQDIETSIDVPGTDNTRGRPIVLLTCPTPAALTPTYYVVGMDQAPSGLARGVSGQLLALAISWATRTSTDGFPVTGSALVPGVELIPTLAGNLVLGQGYTSSYGFQSTIAYVPMYTTAVDPSDPSMLGVPATGAWVFDTAIDADANQAGTGGATAGGNGSIILTTAPTSNAVAVLDVSGAPTLAGPDSVVDVGFIAVHDVAGTFVDIADASNAFAVDSSTGWGFTGASFRISGVANGDGTIFPEVVATSMSISALGMVAFSTDETPVTLDADTVIQLVEDPTHQVVPPIIYAAPFASSSFRANNYLTNKGEETGALAVYVLDDTVNSRYIIQWQGYALNTEDPYTWSGVPVCFQVQITYDEDHTVVGDGQVTFAYSVMPGTWTNERWLTATTMTVYDIGFGAGYAATLLRSPSMPLYGDALYFGSHTLQNHIRGAGNGPLTAVGLYNTTVPYYFQNRVRGTVVAYVPSNTPSFSYLMIDGFPLRDAQRIRVTRVNNQTIGTSALNLPTLTGALATVAPLASPSNPVPVSVYVASVAPLTSFSASATVIGQLLAGFVIAGLPDTTAVFDPSSGELQFTPAVLTLPVSPPFLPPFQSAVMRVPAISLDGHIRQPDIASVTLVVSPVFENSGRTQDFVVQLASTDSTRLDVNFLYSGTTPTCVIVRYDGVDTTTVITKINGFEGFAVTADPPVVIVGADTLTPVVTVTLTYDPSLLRSQRVNTLVVGFPPRANTTPVNDYAIGTVAIQDLQLASWAVTSSIQPSTPYAVTTSLNLGRPPL